MRVARSKHSSPVGSAVDDAGSVYEDIAAKSYSDTSPISCIVEFKFTGGDVDLTASPSCIEHSTIPTRMVEGESTCVHNISCRINLVDKNATIATGHIAMEN